MLVSFAFSLTAPIGAVSLKAIQVGAILWMASLLFAGLGCLLLPTFR